MQEQKTSDFQFSRIFEFPKRIEDYFQVWINKEILKDFTTLFKFLLDEPSTTPIFKGEFYNKLISKIISKQRKVNKEYTVRNQTKDLSIYLITPKIDEKKEYDPPTQPRIFILIFVKYDEQKNKFNMLIPQRMIFHTNLPLLSLNRFISEESKTFITSDMSNKITPIVIYDSNDKLISELNFIKIPLQKLIKYMEFKDNATNKDYEEEEQGDLYMDSLINAIKGDDIGSIRLYNFAVDYMECLKCMQNLINLIV